MRQKQLVRDAEGKYHEEYVFQGESRALPAHGRLSHASGQLRRMGLGVKGLKMQPLSEGKPNV